MRTRLAHYYSDDVDKFFVEYKFLFWVKYDLIKYLIQRFNYLTLDGFLVELEFLINAEKEYLE